MATKAASAQSGRKAAPKPSASKGATRASAGAGRKSKGSVGPDKPVAMLALAGVVLSIYLAMLQATGTHAFLCSEGSGCDIVRSSRYATMLGVPVPLIGIAGYGAAFALALAGGKLRSLFLPLIVAASVGFTGYLVYIQLVVLRAECLYCLASAGIAGALAIASMVRDPGDGMTRARLALLGLAIAVLVGVGATGLSLGDDPEQVDAAWTTGLSTHLTSKQVVMYGAEFCPRCDEQRALFGDSSKAVPYVECDPKAANAKAQVCQAKGVTSYPTWEVNGRLYEGVQPLARLADLSGYVAAR